VGGGYGLQARLLWRFLAARLDSVCPDCCIHDICTSIRIRVD
jgi:hypothetical protein